MIALLISLALFGSADSVAGSTWLQMKSSVGSSPVLPGRSSTRGLAQSYLPENWSDAWMNPEAASQWDALPPLVELGLRARLDSLLVWVDLPLHRDFDAWQQDPMGSNVPLGIDEIDINAPYEGWAQWASSSGGFRIRGGRFRQTFSWSEHGVVLGSNLRHDAILATAHFGRWTFEMFGSSLDPWLVGTGLDGSVDTASEAFIQSHRTIPNQKGRVYDEGSKSLFVHRLSVRFGEVDLAVAELVLIAGKNPELRDVLPFVAWHNNFGDGFSKVSLALQARWSPQGLGVFHAEGVMDEIRSPVGEVKGADARIVYGANLGWRMDPPVGQGGFGGAVDGTITSATLNNHVLPLLKGTSRRRYRSNNREQSESVFIDQWIVDRPLAYHRGPDALDLWTRTGWAAIDSVWGAGFEFDWLNQGDAALWKDARALSNRFGPLSGEVTSEWRLLADAWATLGGRWTLRGQIGASFLSEPEQKLSVGPMGGFSAARLF